MSEQDVTVARFLNEDDIAENVGRVEKGVARARAHVALIDGATLVFAHLWAVLAILAAPLFALLAAHARNTVQRLDEQTGDSQS